MSTLEVGKAYGYCDILVHLQKQTPKGFVVVFDWDNIEYTTHPLSSLRSFIEGKEEVKEDSQVSSFGEFFVCTDVIEGM